MTLEALLNIIGGLGLFLYGMSVLTESLKNFAGKDMQKNLKKFTDRPLKGVLVGAAVTALVQSSTATTLMSMGLVNAGSMSIFEAVPVIMGANIGTTITAQILSLADISSSNFFLNILKPSSLAPFFIFIGALQLIFFKRDENKQSASIFVGLGVLFTGMEIMEYGLKPLSYSPEFQNIFLRFQNPLLAVFLGVLATALIQSSSVSIGILQTLSTTGVISFSAAVPIILGMNIGKCLPEFIASISTGKSARRTIFADLLINAFGAAIFLALFYFLQGIFNFGFVENAATRSNIAMFHTAFNLVTSLSLLPFYKRIIAMSEKVIR